MMNHILRQHDIMLAIICCCFFFFIFSHRPTTSSSDHFAVVLLHMEKFCPRRTLCTVHTNQPHQPKKKLISKTSAFHFAANHSDNFVLFSPFHSRRKYGKSESSENCLLHFHRIYIYRSSNVCSFVCLIFLPRRTNQRTSEKKCIKNVLVRGRRKIATFSLCLQEF